MRKILSFFVFTLSFLLLSNLSFAKETASQNILEEKQATISSVIKYNLAYPGILPDHPLYKLKVLRDKISAVLISEPRKKIEFYLLQTDKGVLASAMLVDKGKIDLAMETALKAEHNYTLIGQEIYKLPVKPSDEFFDKLHKASLKHQEVLGSLAKRVPKDKQKTFLTVIDFSKTNWNAVDKYIKVQEELEAEIET